MNYKKIRRCLICNNNKLKEYVNLGNQPLANNLSKKECYGQKLVVQKEKGLILLYIFILLQLQKHLSSSLCNYLQYSLVVIMYD